jgi:hypothetical protein
MILYFHPRFTVNVVWVSEARFEFLFDPAKKGPKPAPFRIYPVPVK